MLKKWRKIKEKLAYDNFRTVILKTFTLPDGTKHSYDIIGERSGVAVIVVNKKGELLITKEFRPGPEKFLYDVPAGMIDEKEQPLVAAKRELLEETGYTGDFKKLATFVSGAYSAGYSHLFLCTNPVYVQEPELGPHEWIEVRFMGKAQIKKMIEKNLAGPLISLFLSGHFFK